MQSITRRLLLILILLADVFSAYSQLTAPGRNWAGLTQYAVSSFAEDSIFVFYANSGTLKCQHTTGHLATFSWYKYNPKNTVAAGRFELYQTVTGQTSSELAGLSEGGYQVKVVDNTDSIEIFTAWVFADNVVLSRIDVDNSCEFLELSAAVIPASYNIDYDRFVYYDLSRPTQPEVNTYGKGYFQDITWSASDSRIELVQSTVLIQVVENPAPLYNSKYGVEITNIFDRVMALETDEIVAVSAKSVQKVQVDSDGSWVDFDSSSDYEALLGLRLESSSINADSLYWYLLNQQTVDYAEDYFVIWKDSALIAARVESFPAKNMLRPGYFKVKQVAVNTSSGCRDSVEVEIAVDSSKIKSDAIPNVFSPNGKGGNNRFKFIDPEDNLKSIRSFRIKIFSRSGKLVYEYSGDPKEWEGWDGKLKGSGATAATGVYFFIIEAKGWDGKEFDYGPYKGFLHLYNK